MLSELDAEKVVRRHRLLAEVLSIFNNVHSFGAPPTTEETLRGRVDLLRLRMKLADLGAPLNGLLAMPRFFVRKVADLDVKVFFGSANEFQLIRAHGEFGQINYVREGEPLPPENLTALLQDIDTAVSSVTCRICDQEMNDADVMDERILMLIPYQEKSGFTESVDRPAVPPGTLACQGAYAHSACLESFATRVSE